MRKILGVCFLAVIFAMGAGCAKKIVSKNWEAAGGSRSDAIVELGFVYNPSTETPQYDDKQALQVALKRCQAWGYQDVEPFGMVKNTCQQYYNDPFAGPGCLSMYVSRQYQCLGKGDGPSPVIPEIGNMKK